MTADCASPAAPSSPTPSSAPACRISAAAITAIILVELRNVMGEVSGIRRLGSAALDLAYVAAGRMDGFWETGPRRPGTSAPASCSSARPAVSVSDMAGGQDMLDTGSVVAGNEAIHRALLKTLKKPVPAR